MMRMRRKRKRATRPPIKGPSHFIVFFVRAFRSSEALFFTRIHSDVISPSPYSSLPCHSNVEFKVIDERGRTNSNFDSVHFVVEMVVRSIDCCLGFSLFFTSNRFSLRPQGTNNNPLSENENDLSFLFCEQLDSFLFSFGTKNGANVRVLFVHTSQSSSAEIHIDSDSNPSPPERLPTVSLLCPTHLMFLWTEVNVGSFGVLSWKMAPSTVRDEFSMNKAPSSRSMKEVDRRSHVVFTRRRRPVFHSQRPSVLDERGCVIPTKDEKPMERSSTSVLMMSSPTLHFFMSTFWRETDLVPVRTNGEAEKLSESSFRLFTFSVFSFITNNPVLIEDDEISEH
ncbi:hypothetical protein BLNAU_10025 [Blattamonas nauphoetae]|uniref:Uncharacterized protein n=1 Tax=Blattamonas nauphoetae TaxID=2049346 RepID=A0ABQ9XUE3_9EUKA|nr:hypothetical protein BLNAU_10025 [Blattamonas nauphoetae]